MDAQMDSQRRETIEAQPLRALDPRFLDSSYIPSDSKVVRPKVLLVGQANGLAREQEELLATQQTSLGKLEAREQLPETSIVRCYSTVGMQRVPDEIWETIFAILCISLHNYSLDIDRIGFDWHNEERLTRITAPTMTLCLVCTRWRDIAEACPSLWSSISIEFSAPSDITRPLRTYLDHSKAYPLKVCVLLGREDDYGLQELPLDKQRAWQLLAPHLKRCKELVLGVTNIGLFPPPAEVLTFPNLELLWDYTDSDDSMTAEPRWLRDALHGACKLGNITVVNVLRQSIRYNQIQSLTIQNFDIGCAEALFKVLPSCTALASLTLWPGRTQWPGPVPPALRDVLEIPSLRHLTFRNYMVDPVRDISLSTTCSSLKVPSLTSFSITSKSWPSALSNLLRHCSPTLERATINLWLFPQREEDTLEPMLPLLQSLSYLNHLELAVTRVGISTSIAPHVIHIFTTLLSKLIPEEGATTFLPELRSIHLKFSDVGMTIELAERVLGIVTSRRGTSTPLPLTYFRLTPGSNPATAEQGKLVLNNDVLEKIKRFRDNGIHVVFDEVSESN